MWTKSLQLGIVVGVASLECNSKPIHVVGTSYWTTVNNSVMSSACRHVCVCVHACGR